MSTFHRPQMSNLTHAHSLTGALSSLRTSTHLLSTTLAFLDTSVADLPRLGRVLAQRRFFELLPSSTLKTAQEQVVGELGPEVEGLLARAEEEVERLERRREGLVARWGLLEGRLGGEGDDSRGVAGGRNGSGATRAAGTRAQGRGGNAGNTGNGGREGAGRALGAREEIKAQQLRQKKERLSYAVERLTLQASQAERKLRMSMAAQEVRSGGVRDEDETDELA